MAYVALCGTSGVFLVNSNARREMLSMRRVAPSTPESRRKAGPFVMFLATERWSDCTLKALFRE